MFRLLHDAASGAMGYLLADESTAEAVFIDPRASYVPALRALLGARRLRLRWILRTHEHDAMMPRESSALVMLGAPVIERQVPSSAAGRIRFGAESVRVLATPGPTCGWPPLWVLLIRQVPGPAGLVGPFVTALAALLGLARLHRALWVNHRYWFTTWRWARYWARCC